MQNETWYFAYGSNLSKPQMVCRTGSLPVSITARLLHYQFAFRRVNHGLDVYATIVPTVGAVVQGAAYLCSSHAMAQLDRFEGVAESCYRRAIVQVTTIAGKDLECVAYVGQSFHEAHAIPSDSYLDLILTGAESHQLTTDYIASVARLARKGKSF